MNNRNHVAVRGAAVRGAAVRGAGGGLLIALLLSGSGFAQAAPAGPAAPDDEIAALRAQIGALQQQVKELPALLERLDRLEAAQKKSQEAPSSALSPVSPVAPPLVGKAKLPIVVSGLVQVHGLATLSDSGPAPGKADTFRLRRGQIGLQAQITPRVSALAAFDIAKAQDNNDRKADSVLQDLYVTYQLKKSEKQSHAVDVGQYKVPFGYESLVPTSALPLLEPALMYQVRDPIRGKYGDGRETGVQLRGTQGRFDYRVGFFNGFGERQNDLALSDTKAVIGRLGYRLTPALQIGISGARGNTGINASGARADRSLWNAYAVYKRDRFSLQGEYTVGDYTDPTPAVQKVRSYYGSVGYHFTPKLEGVARADFFDYRSLNAGITESSLGLNYYLKGNNAKIQLNLVKRNGDPVAPGTSFDNDATEVRTNFQVGF